MASARPRIQCVRACPASSAGLPRELQDEPWLGSNSRGQNQFTHITQFTQTKHFIKLPQAGAPSDKDVSSVDPDLWIDLYASSPQNDPWNYEHSRFELTKYGLQIALLSDRRYASALELACSNGVLTAMLAPLCDSLLAVDHVALAVERARERLSHESGVRIERATLPNEFPSGTFDLVTFAEVGYYLNDADNAEIHRAVTAAVRPGGRAILTHHAISFENTYRGHAIPSSCAEIHGRFMRDPRWRLVSRALGNDAGGVKAELRGPELYRIDLFERTERESVP